MCFKFVSHSKAPRGHSQPSPVKCVCLCGTISVMVEEPFGVAGRDGQWTVLFKLYLFAEDDNQTSNSKIFTK